MKNSLALDDRVVDFFVNLSKAIIKQRKSESGNGRKRTDLVQLLMDSFVYESELEGDNYDKLTATADNGTPFW